MSEPILHERNAYLQRIADRLPFEEAEKLDIVHELEGHLSDSMTRLEADGLSPHVAERTAIDRLGPPERLADSLTEARRSPRRLLAAAGAGTLSALNGVVYGYLFALLVIQVVWFVSAGLAAALQPFGAMWTSPPSITAMTVAAIAVGAYAAGRKVTVTVAARAGYRVRSARRLTAVLGAAVILAYVLFGWRGSLNWPEVTMLLSLPAWYVLGSWRASAAPFPSRRWHLEIIGVAAIAVPLSLGVGLAQSGGGSGSGSFRPEGVELIGLPRPASIEAAVSGTEGGLTAAGRASSFVVLDDAAVLTGWVDFEVEAWSGTGGREIWNGVSRNAGALSRDATSPFAAAPATLESTGVMARLGGAVTVDRTPGVTLAWIAITGVGPDGRRYILEGPGFVTTAFSGTVADWLAAVISGR